MLPDQFQVTKADTTLGVVFGWASVVEYPSESGRVAVVDKQGDLIPPSVLEQAVVKFMLDSRTSGVMHAGDAVGTIVESAFLSPEKMVAMGFPAEVAKTSPSGWWIGVKVKDDLMALVQAGVYKMFSIQGDAEVVNA